MIKLNVVTKVLWDDEAKHAQQFAHHTPALCNAASSAHAAAAPQLLHARVSRNSHNNFQQQLMIPGLTELTHQDSHNHPMLVTFVRSQDEAHTLANSLATYACFWACHMSVVLAVPYRFWLSSATHTVTYTIVKEVVFARKGIGGVP